MRILIVDDHPIVRAGVAQLIRQHWPQADLVEAGSLAEAMTRLREAGWQAIVLDLSLPDANGVEGLARLRRALPQTPVLVLSMHAEAAYAARALQTGASGYLTKDRAGQELIAALDRILAGGRYVTASLAESLADLLTGRAIDRPAHESLSAQEHRVLLMLAEGRSVGEAAESMHLSVKTVSTYRGRILDKLQLRSNAELTRYCLTHGLIQL
jgi:two-component system, NarL family, invasion response regulator UvrY